MLNLKVNNMTQEEKQLLLQDLCARLPYNTHIFTNSKHHIRLLTITNDIDYDEQFWINGLYDVDEVKPYLRSMSSMTEEERKKYHSYCDYYYGNYFDTVESIDWLNVHHFDYRGLIKKGLALEAPEGMYNVKKK